METFIMLFFILGIPTILFGYITYLVIKLLRLKIKELESKSRE